MKDEKGRRGEGSKENTAIESRCKICECSHIQGADKTSNDAQGYDQKKNHSSFFKKCQTSNF